MNVYIFYLYFYTFQLNTMIDLILFMYSFFYTFINIKPFKINTVINWKTI